jgi:hypothetical protein
MLRLLKEEKKTRERMSNDEIFQTQKLCKQTRKANQSP